MKLFALPKQLNALRVASITRRYVNLYKNFEKENGGMIRRDHLESLMKGWSQELLDLFSIQAQRIGATPSSDPVIFVGNHVSYVDIPLILSKTPVRFVAKAELQKWPILNSAFNRADIIFVKRESQTSRKNTTEAIRKALDDKKAVCLFPSGTTDIKELKPWKRGAFQVAKDLNIPIQPFRLTYTDLRRVAYIDDDFFFTHIFRLANSERIVGTIEFHEPILVDDPKVDAEKWWRWSQQIQPNNLK